MIRPLSHRYRRACAAIIMALVLFWSAPRLLHAASLAPRVAPQAAESQETGAGEGESSGGWGSTIAKGFNFVALAALLAYFLRTPFAGYLRDRGETIRKDLREAAALRATSERQLGDVRQRLASLPGEIESLRRRGQEELAQERVRLTDATARERQNVLDRTRREIDLQFRLAHRALLEHTTELSMRLARTRLERDMTPEDQQRLIDRYSAEVRA